CESYPCPQQRLIPPSTARIPREFLDDPVSEGFVKPGARAHDLALTVNPSRRQYLDAGRIRMWVTRPGILHGLPARMLGSLVFDSGQVKTHDHTSPLGVSWLGDSIIVPPGDSEPDLCGVRTATGVDPGRNLYRMACEEFEDLSQPALAMLATD